MRRIANVAIWAGSSAVGALAVVGFALWMKGYGEPWIGFAGSIIGGLMTLFAAVIAWLAATAQMRNDRTLATRTEDDARREFIVGIRRLLEDINALWIVADQLTDAQDSEAIEDAYDRIIIARGGLWVTNEEKIDAVFLLAKFMSIPDGNRAVTLRRAIEVSIAYLSILPQDGDEERKLKTYAGILRARFGKIDAASVDFSPELSKVFVGRQRSKKALSVLKDSNQYGFTQPYVYRVEFIEEDDTSHSAASPAANSGPKS